MIHHPRFGIFSRPGLRNTVIRHKVYILDISVPLSALDAIAGGPKLTSSSVFQLAFTTSANTNNPVQKDLAYQEFTTWRQIALFSLATL